MPRPTPVTRRTALAALAALAVAPLAACTGPATPSIVPNTPAMPAAPTGPATTLPAPGAPVATIATDAAITAPTATVVPTLPPLTMSVAATGTALSSTSAALSATATTVAVSAPVGTSVVVTAGSGTTITGTVPGTSAPLGPITEASIPAPTVTPAAAVPTTAAPTAAFSTAIPTIVPTVAPIPVLPALGTTAPAVQAVVDRARTRFDRVTTLHFVLSVEGAIYIDDARTQRLTAAEGDLVRPDRVSLVARVAVGSVVAQLKFIQVAEMAFLTNILTGRWQTAPAGFSYDPRLVFNPTSGVSAIIGQAPVWTLVEMVRVANQDTQHLRGIVPAAVAAPLVSNSLRGDYVDVDIYVEGRNNDVLKLVLAEQPAAVADGVPVSKWTLDLSRQNMNLSIDAPTIGATAPR